MYYYEIIPATNSFHGRKPLTYSFSQSLRPGQVVKIKLRKASSLGIILKKTSKPIFKVVELDGIVENCLIPGTHLDLLKWMVDFYPSTFGVIAQLFAPSFLINFKAEPVDQNEVHINSDKLPSLTQDQARAYKEIKKNASPGKQSSILHGITASGKTRLYIELAKDSLLNKKSVLILTPEISLTAPVATEFKKVFNDAVFINHSSLTPKQRLGLFVKLLSSDNPKVVVGPRSSLFLPLFDIGLVAVDEFHESAYKQESQPFYHANRVASMLAKLSSANIVFGSATPPLNDYYLAKQKNAPIIELTRSAITSEVPSGQALIVNLLDEKERSNYPLLSNTLISKISGALKKGEQAMLFINKRGSARSITCQSCGHREVCTNCDLPMVYHSDQHLIRCHTCGLSLRPPTKCPKCGSADIYFSSPGTKAIEDSLSRLFPEAKIARFDKDNKKLERLENNYEQARDNLDIIVGTQIIAKGHDFPRLSLVGMLQADSGLEFPDYSSSERSYQMIKQLSGRVNRGHRKGIFLVQTFGPSNSFIKAATKSGWSDFYDQEMKQREKHGFPPFYYALKIECGRKSRDSAKSALDKLLRGLVINGKQVEVLGPSPCFVEKKSSKWQWQVILKSKNRSFLVNVARLIPSSFTVNIDPANFL